MTEPTPGTHSDDEVNAIVARTKRETEAKARKARDEELATELGVPLDQVKQVMADAKAAAEAKLDAAQRAERERDSFKAETETHKSAAAAAAHRLSVVESLYMAGLPAGDKELLADALALVRVQTGADEAAIAEAVGKVKERHETMFSAKPASPTAPTEIPSTDPGRGPANRSSAPTAGLSPLVTKHLAREGIVRAVS